MEARHIPQQAYLLLLDHVHAHKHSYWLKMLLVFVSGTTLFLVLQLVAAQMQIFWLIHLAFRHFIDNKWWYNLEKYIN